MFWFLFYFMAITKEKKQEKIKELLDLLANQTSIIFVDIKGLNCQALFDFRKKIKPESGCIKVIKKTLAIRAFQDKGYPITKNDLIGQTALVFNLKQSNSLKLSYKFAQTSKHFKIINGFFDNRLINKEQIYLLATSPSKEIMLQQITGVITSPLSQLVFTLEQGIRKFIMVLLEIQKKKSL